MTTLALTLAGLAPGILAALAYWVPRAAMRARREREAELRTLAASPGGQALARGLRRLAAGGCGDGPRVNPWPPRPAPPPRTGPPIEVLKLRAAKVSTRLYCNGNADASRVIDNAIKGGDREVLLAILREETP